MGVGQLGGGGGGGGGGASRRTAGLVPGADRLSIARICHLFAWLVSPPLASLHVATRTKILQTFCTKRLFREQQLGQGKGVAQNSDQSGRNNIVLLLSFSYFNRRPERWHLFCLPSFSPPLSLFPSRNPSLGMSLNLVRPYPQPPGGIRVPPSATTTCSCLEERG